jgi:hypothetical protein
MPSIRKREIITPYKTELSDEQEQAFALLLSKACGLSIDLQKLSFLYTQ